MNEEEFLDVFSFLKGFTIEEARATIKKYDDNGDGRMNFDEFEKFLLEFKQPNDKGRMTTLRELKR